MQKKPTNRAVGRATLAILAVWFMAAFAGGITGIFNQEGQPPVYLGLIIGLPIAGFIAVYAASKRFRMFAGSINMALLVGSHIWRLVGFVFLALWLANELPGEFAIPEGTGDILAAVAAAPLAYLIWKGVRVRRALLVWNTFGLVDLVAALIVGILYSNSQAGVLSGPVTTEAMVIFPVSMIPTFFVPLYILIHLLIFARLRENKNNSSL
jgi:hypothetical protein